MIYGYLRGLAGERELDSQRARLQAVDCEELVTDIHLPVGRQSQPALSKLLGRLVYDDVLVAVRLDRLAASMVQLRTVAKTLRTGGVVLKVLDQAIDTSSIGGERAFDFVEIFAEFDFRLRSERRRQEVSAARARGQPRGPKPRIDPREVHRLRHEEKLNAQDIALKLGIARGSVYRLLASSIPGADEQDA